MMNPETLGHLLVMQAVMVNLPSALSIFQFVRKGLESFPDVTDLKILTKDEIKTVPEETSFRAVVSDFSHSGYCLVAEIQEEPNLHEDNSDSMESYEPYLRNFLNMVQIIIEDKNQKRLLEEQNRILSETVEAKNQLQRELVVQEKIAGLLPLSTIIAHGMNTPLGNIITLGTNILDRTQDIEQQIQTGITQREFHGFLENITESLSSILIDGHRATKLVDRFQNVLDSSQHVSDKSHLNLHSQVVNAIEEVASRENCDLLDFEVCLDQDPWITSYPTAISRILGILLENVHHHAYPGLRIVSNSSTTRDNVHTETPKPKIPQGKVIIGGGVDSQSGLSLWVQDYGIGIAQEKLDHIFDPFVTTALEHGHNGLGLSIAHYIATQHLSGHMIAESTIDSSSPSGHHTRFTLIAPLQNMT